MKTIHGYHAHVYFDEHTYDQALNLSQTASQLFPLRMGRMHQQSVGPHPRGSCQLSFKAALFGEVIPWLLNHRKGLTVFVHTLTGYDYLDHTDNAIWLGDVENIDLSAL